MKNFAAIFDFDGVVIDSSTAHEKSWKSVADSENLPFPEGSFLKTFGQTNAHVIPNILNWAHSAREVERLSKRKEDLYRKYASDGEVSLVAGVKDFLKALKAVGVPCAVGSSAPLKNVLFALERFGLEKYFCAIASAEDVKRSKPAPDVFLCAAKKLEFAPADCVVFEDSLHGIEAARAAGMKKAAIATTFSQDFWESKRVDLIMPDFENATPQKIAGLW